MCKAGGDLERNQEALESQKVVLLRGRVPLKWCI